MSRAIQSISPQEAGARLSEHLVKGMYEILNVIGNVAATEYMIMTGTGRRSRLPRPDVPVHPSKLTWRTGRLARSLVRGTDSDAIEEVKVEGTRIIGRKGTRVPYAAIHEYGGTIQHPGGTAYIVTRRGARFISNAEAETTRRQVRRTRPHPITIPARPYLRPAVQSATVQDAMARIVREHVRDWLRETRFIGGGSSR
jgi:phage gpG-like protein